MKSKLINPLLGWNTRKGSFPLRFTHQLEDKEKQSEKLEDKKVLFL